MGCRLESGGICKIGLEPDFLAGHVKIPVGMQMKLFLGKHLQLSQKIGFYPHKRSITYHLPPQHIGKQKGKQCDKKVFVHDRQLYDEYIKTCKDRDKKQ